MTPKQKRKKAQKAACSSGKVAYTSKEAAMFFAKTDRAIYREHKYAYLCAECKLWHLATKRRKDDLPG